MATLESIDFTVILTNELDDLRAELEAVKAERDALKEKIIESIVSYDADGSFRMAGHFISPDVAQLLCALDDARRWSAAWKAAAKHERNERIVYRNSASILLDAQSDYEAMQTKMRKWRKRAKKAERLKAWVLNVLQDQQLSYVESQRMIEEKLEGGTE